MPASLPTGSPRCPTAPGSDAHAATLPSRRSASHARENGLTDAPPGASSSTTSESEAEAAAANTTGSSSSDNRLANLHRRPATATHPPMYRLDSDVMPRGYTICYALASLRERDRHRALQLAGVKRRACSGENTRSTRALHCPISRLLMIRLA